MTYDIIWHVCDWGGKDQRNMSEFKQDEDVLLGFNCWVKKNWNLFMNTNKRKILHVHCLICLLFDGVSTFLGYLMPNPSLSKDSGSTI